jgi:hypothetical protein
MPASPKTKRMPKWRPAPEAMVTKFDQAMLPFPQAERRKMFGYPCSRVRPTAICSPGYTRTA